MCIKKGIFTSPFHKSFFALTRSIRGPKMISYVFVCFLLFGTALANMGMTFSYDAQDQWPDICVNGNTMRQSPIDILTDNVEESDTLIELELSDDWMTAYDGTFFNGGHNVQFDPDFTGTTAPTSTNHLGTYELLQFHFHWGAMIGEGSEHLIDGGAADMEIHFVQKMQGATDSSAGDYLAVIGVLLDVEEGAELSGPWETLDASAIQQYPSNISISDFRLDVLLPESLDYYYYEGSLTTPPCSEIVSWFVLKERITVPAAYVEQLRQIIEENGEDALTFNFRMPQALAGRQVSTPASSQATLKPFLSVLMLCLAIIKLF